MPQKSIRKSGTFGNLSKLGAKHNTRVRADGGEQPSPPQTALLHVLPAPSPGSRLRNLSRQTTDVHFRGLKRQDLYVKWI